MKKAKPDEKFIKQPYYEGGDKAIKDFISGLLNYPPESLQNDIEGDVHLRYEIDYKGNVTEVKIIGGLDTLCNEEAIRVVKLLKFIVPKTPRHIKVSFQKTISIHFRKNDKIAISSEDTTQSESGKLNFSYTITSQKPSVNPEPEMPVLYHYTIGT